MGNDPASAGKRGFGLGLHQTGMGIQICMVVFRLEPMPKVSLYKIAHVIQGKTMLQAALSRHGGAGGKAQQGREIKC
jgi:hypothetical protein